MTCARLWSVEAARDGRLPEGEAALVRRHLETCRDCAAEAARFDALATGLRALPAREPDAVSARREKQRLLSAIDATLVAPPRSRWRVAMLVAAPAAVLLVVIGVVSANRHPVVAAKAGAVDARGAGTWVRHREGKLETITLSDGRVALRVQRSSPDERVIVSVPDGEIEDRGTTFSVEVAGGHTQRISVEDGVVEYRRAGGPTVVLSAGESWTREPELPRDALVAPASVPASIVAPPTPAMSEAALPVALPTRATPPVRAPGRQAAPSASVPAPSNFGADFHALATGRDREAASLLTLAESGADDDARAEDAAYLRVVALERAGDRDKARAAARTYLERFPRGFRRSEVERVLK